jgi:hypothetical protein
MKRSPSSVHDQFRERAERCTLQLVFMLLGDFKTHALLTPLRTCGLQLFWPHHLDISAITLYCTFYYVSYVRISFELYWFLPFRCVYKNTLTNKSVERNKLCIVSNSIQPVNKNYMFRLIAIIRFETRI